MKSAANSKHAFRLAKLTRRRMVSALVVAIVADALQWLLGPAGWAFGDQIIDVIVMLVTSWLIGFHWLLLPSFILEVFPLVDEFPTWTACVIAVIVLRRHQLRQSPPSPSEGPIIDV